jgi:hypothetical protein
MKVHEARNQAARTGLGGKYGSDRFLHAISPLFLGFLASAARGLPFPEAGSRRRFSPRPQPRPRDDEKWAKATEDKE